MHINFHGKVTDEREIRAGFIGCGSHSFRNIYAAFQFAPIDLVATCDLIETKAEAFAVQFGAERVYTDHRMMLDQETLDAVFIVTGYDERGRPRYPALAEDCLHAGCHVWMEKPPAASSAALEALATVAERVDRNVMVGLKKMFFPANEKAKTLMARPDFGDPELVMLQYPQYVPAVAEFRAYLQHEVGNAVVGFLDHLCHPASLLLFLLGMPDTLTYQRSERGAGIATFSYECGTVASLAFTHGAPNNRGMERTTIIDGTGHRIVVENNVRVYYDRMAPLGYGNVPDYYQGEPDEMTAVWEPEFSLGQLYNKGLFLLGYVGEVDEFARSILEARAPSKATLAHAVQVTRLFEAFAEGPGHEIALR